MSLKLYSAIGSPAVRGTLLTIRALGLSEKVNIIKVELPRKDQLKQEFVKKNPLHTVPLLEDGDFVLWDSHAINGYLVNKYADNDALYPKDPQKRALVDSMNHFDTGYLFGKGVKIIKAVFTLDKTANLEKLKEETLEVLDMLELILAQRKFVAGNEMSIADFSIVATLSTIEIYIPLKEDRYPRIIKWYKSMRELPYYKINQSGVDVFKGYFNHMASKL